MERAGEAVLRATAVHGELDTAMAAVVVVRLDGLFVDAHDDDRLVEDLVDDEIAGPLDLLQATGHLPHVRPEFFLLEAIELGVVIAAGIDPIGSRYGEGN